jgi:hypothetical protein
MSNKDYIEETPVVIHESDVQAAAKKETKKTRKRESVKGDHSAASLSKQRSAASLSKQRSVFADNVKSNLSVVQEAISDAGLFNQHYETVMNTIDTINEQVKTYNLLSYSSISRDLFDMGMASVDFDKARGVLMKKLKADKCPDYGELRPITAPSFKLSKIDADQFSDMWSSLIENDKKAIQRYIETKNEVAASLNDYVDGISLFESKMVEHRARLAEIVRHNISELLNMHASYAWCVKNKVPTEHFNETGIILCKSQKEFVERNLKRMLRIDEE